MDIRGDCAYTSSLLTNRLLQQPVAPARGTTLRREDKPKELIADGGMLRAGALWTSGRADTSNLCTYRLDPRLIDQDHHQRKDPLSDHL